MDSDHDAGVLFEPLTDRREALSFCFGSSYLGPKGAQLAGLSVGLFPAPLSEAAHGLSDPWVLDFCVFVAFFHRINSLRGLST